MGDPMVDWLKANDIDLDRIAMWPEIELLPGRAKIEYLYGLEDEPPRPNLVLRRPTTRMVERPTPVPMPLELWEAYQRGRADYLAERMLKTLGRAGATVLAVQPGAHLVLVSSNVAMTDQGFLEQAAEVLGRALTGVEVTIMTGVDTILHRAPQEDR